MSTEIDFTIKQQVQFVLFRTQACLVFQRSVCILVSFAKLRITFASSFKSVCGNLTITICLSTREVHHNLSDFLSDYTEALLCSVVVLALIALVYRLPRLRFHSVYLLVSEETILSQICLSTREVHHNLSAVPRRRRNYHNLSEAFPCEGSALSQSV